MANRFTLLFFMMLLAMGATSQSFRRTAQAGSQSVVVDSSGRVYPTALWQRLVYTGDYTLQSNTGTEVRNDFIIRPTTPEERIAYMEGLPKPEESKAFKRGRTLPSFTGTDLHGTTYTLHELKGKVVVLNFWYVGCGPCRAEIPHLNNVQQTYKDSNVVFLAIALDGESALHPFLKQFPFTYNIIPNGEATALRYGVRFYPTHVVLDASGKVRFSTTGLAANTVYWVEKSIAAALAEKG